MNPYQTPASPAAETTPLKESGQLWQVSDFSLWVRDGASLPDVCLYGSAVESTTRGVLKLVMLGPVGRFIKPILGLALIVVLGWLTVQGVRSLFLFGSIVAAVISVHLLTPRILGTRAFQGGKLSIHISTGNRGRSTHLIHGVVRSAMMFLPVFASGSFRWLRVEESMEMGAFFTWMFAVFWVDDLVERLIFPTPCEARSGWFKLKNIHPSALVRLEEIQQRPGSIK